MSFLTVPPFPSARASHPQVRRASHPVQLDDWIVDRLRSARVGGRYWGEVGAPGTGRVAISSTDRRDPWSLIEGATMCWLEKGADDVALIAMLLDTPIDGPWLDQKRSFEDLLRDRVFAWSYDCPFSRQPLQLEQAIDYHSFWRTLIDSNRRLKGAMGIGFWKRETVDPLLWPGDGAGEGIGTHVALWRSRADPRQLATLGTAAVAEVEDGFIRSVGLGADCVPPLSIVVDFSGIYFDPSKPSDLETMLQEQEFDPAILARAAALRALLVDRGVSKYGTGAAAKAAARPDGYLLVVGQVEDDRSIQLGTSTIRTNLDLLRRVRADHPDATIVYRPHPDVEAGHRRGRINQQEALLWADEVAAADPITDLIAGASQVHVMTSLAGFEALLRGKMVVTYGAPFYAGWGLTADMGEIPTRRTKTRNIDELVAAALLLYPRYLDPVTRLPCPPELLVDRLTAAAPDRPSLLTRLRRWQGRLRRWLN